MSPEIQEYLNHLSLLRAKVLQTIDEAKPELWNWKMSDDSNSLFVLATHCIGSEHGWIYEMLGRGEKTRDRASEFLAQSRDLGELHAHYQHVAAETETILAARTETDLTTTRLREGFGEVSERWIVLHVIAHYSEHLGQMYLTKQLGEKEIAGNR